MDASTPADPAGTSPGTGVSAEEQLLRDALGDDLAGRLRVISREPFGAGALTGFEEASDDGASRHWYVDTSRRPVETETGYLLGDPEHPEARIWLHPADPRLPALAPASFPDAAAILMRRLGVHLDRKPELLIYRPGKRAMFRMRSGDRDTYLKIVRPSASETIVHLHEALRAAGLPVPRITGWSDLGIVLTEAAAGEPLTSRIADAEPERLLDSIESLRAAMTPVDTGCAGRASLAERLDWYLDRIDTALAQRNRSAENDGPDASAVAALVAEIAHLLASTDASALQIDETLRCTVHGDLHVGQLFVSARDASAVTGMIDVDTCGTGDPADDEAALMGHLVASIALASGDSADGDAVRDGYRRLLAAATRRWLAPERPGRIRVAHRTAVHVLAHALTPIERGEYATAAEQLELGLERLRPVVDDRR